MLRHQEIEAMNVEAKYYYCTLLQSPFGKPGMDYLTYRGISDETIEDFDIGYAGDDKDGLTKYLIEQGFDRNLIIAAGLAKEDGNKRVYDTFRRRVIFPVIDEKGCVVGFCGRAVGNEKPKYLISNETELWDKDKSFFGMNFAKESSSDYLLLCEGFMDVIALYQTGYDMGIVAMGYSLSRDHAIALRKMKKEVLTCYDNDKAGKKQTEKTKEILNTAGVHVRSIDLAPYKDPDDFILNEGPFSFDERITDARTAKTEKINGKRQKKTDSDSKECFTMSTIYNFEKFLTCEGNLIAFNAAKAVANSPTTTFNPLYIYGGHGTGKTHLLKAIKSAISESYPKLNVLYVTAEKFCNDILEAIRCGESWEIRDIYRTPDVLLLDDIQFLVGKKTSLSEFSHTIEDLLGEGGQLVFSADKPPRKLDVDEYLRARLGMGLIAELKAPDISMKSNLVRTKAGERGVLLQDDVVEYISANMGPNISDIEGAITSIVAFSELTRPVITLDTAKKVLKDVIIE